MCVYIHIPHIRTYAHSLPLPLAHTHTRQPSNIRRLYSTVCCVLSLSFVHSHSLSVSHTQTNDSPAFLLLVVDRVLCSSSLFRTTHSFFFSLTHTHTQDYPAYLLLVLDPVLLSFTVFCIHSLSHSHTHTQTTAQHFRRWYSTVC